MFHDRAGGHFADTLTFQSETLHQTAQRGRQQFLIAHLCVRPVAANKRDAYSADDRDASRACSNQHVYSLPCSLVSRAHALNYGPTGQPIIRFMTKRFYHMTWMVLAAATLAACGETASPPPPPVMGQPAASAPRERLNHLVERYWDENAAADPWYSWGAAEMRYAEPPGDTLAPQALADSLALERRYLDAVNGVLREPLNADDKLTYDVFRRERELTIESFTFPSELLPVNAYDGIPQRFAVMAAAAEHSALAGDRDFAVWQSRAQAYERWTQQAIFNLREGMRRGYTLPLAVVSRTLPMLASLGEDTPASVFYVAQRAVPRTGDDAERTRLSAAINGVVREKVLPSYRELHDFLQREYLPRARNSLALSALPLGQAWYAYLARRATDGTQTPAELHAQGAAEVERLHARLQALLTESGVTGGEPGIAPPSADDLLAAVQGLKTQVSTAVPALFAVAPRADFEIRSIEPFRMATSPRLSYRPALASGRSAAVLYVNSADLKSGPLVPPTPQYLREAVPGHHYQLALQQERADLPRFRRFGGAPAFIAGWGLYAATLGEELGVYDAAGRYGALLAQLQCAAGVVVDTGIHAQNWSRAQALDYLRAHVPLDELSAANLVDRAVALPAEALSCLAGITKLKNLRAHAEQTLGTHFDEQAFHTALLHDGALPLDLLDAAMARWLEAAVAAAAQPAPPEPGPREPAPPEPAPPEPAPMRATPVPTAGIAPNRGRLEARPAPVDGQPNLD
jgi:uncharacterized protein (DUF885 family)